MAKSKYKKVVQQPIALRKEPLRLRFKSDGCVWEEIFIAESMNPNSEWRWFKCVFSPRHTVERPSPLIGKEVNWTQEQIDEYYKRDCIERIDNERFAMLTCVDTETD